MKFAANRNPKTLVGHYLDDISNVDGTATFLGLEPQRNITEDFRSASMKRNPDLLHSLPTQKQDRLVQRQDYVSLCQQIDSLSFQIKTALTEEARNKLKAQQEDFYYQRRKLRKHELDKYRRSQRRLYNAQREVHIEGDWRRGYFDRIVYHMIPERGRLANILGLAVPSRSPHGISALQDLTALLKNDSRVAYQEMFRPIEGLCPVPSCDLNIER